MLAVVTIPLFKGCHTCSVVWSPERIRKAWHRDLWLAIIETNYWYLYVLVLWNWRRKSDWRFWQISLKWQAASAEVDPRKIGMDNEWNHTREVQYVMAYFLAWFRGILLINIRQRKLEVEFMGWKCNNSVDPAKSPKLVTASLIQDRARLKRLARKLGWISRVTSWQFR